MQAIDTLIDTGAAIFIFIRRGLAEMIAEVYQIGLRSVPKRTFLTATGKQISAIREAIYLDLDVAGHWSPQQVCYVADDITADMIIGNIWMKEHGAMPDPFSGMVHFRRNHCQHPVSHETRNVFPEVRARDLRNDSALDPKEFVPEIPNGWDPNVSRNGKPLPKIQILKNPRHSGMQKPDGMSLRENSTNAYSNPPDQSEALGPKGANQTANQEAESLVGSEPTLQRGVVPLEHHPKEEIDDQKLHRKRYRRIQKRRQKKNAKQAARLQQPTEPFTENEPPKEVPEKESGSAEDEALHNHAISAIGSEDLEKVRKRLNIVSVGGAAFQTAARLKGSEVFSLTPAEICAITPEDIERHKQVKNAEEADPKTVLPPELWEFAHVFSKQASNELPKHRPHDHRIEIEDGQKLPPTQGLRRHDEAQNEVIRQYIEENLGRQWITPSTAPYASPILFVRKPDGSLRLCVDYRGLNAVTKKSKYPLPLIDETIAQIRKAKIYSKIDIRQAFHRLRMDPDSEELTTFSTRYGNYQYKVMPFGLCNAPSSFQRFMNDGFMDMLDRFLSIYLDDLIIFSGSRKEHREHLRQVMQRLDALGIQADIKKCKFYTTEVKYLGLIITPEGIKMDPERAEVIRNWEKPTSLTEVRRFLGFLNYYRRFIHGFSKIAAPLHSMLKKDGPKWDSSCDDAFQALKNMVVSPPILAHFQLGRQIVLEFDSSEGACGGIMSQYGDDGSLHPVAFYSASLNSAERNYAIYDKELKAIIEGFERWGPELMTAPPEQPIEVYSDHLSLQYFMKNRKLSARQARWSELLSQFNFKIVYRPGAKNSKADALTRRPEDINRAKDDPNRYRVLLPEVNLDDRIRADLPAVAAVEPDTEETLVEEMTKANQCSESLDAMRTALASPEKTEEVKDGYRLPLCSVVNGALWYQDRLVVPPEKVARFYHAIHDSTEVGHAGFDKTRFAIKQAGYYVLGLDTSLRRFLRNCHTCNRTKPYLAKPAGTLQPLPLSKHPWKDISMDFVTGLPKDKDSGCDAILNVVDRFTKQRHYVPCRAGEQGTSSKATAMLLIKHVYPLHGLPDTIVSDRGTQFVSDVWKSLCRTLQIKQKLSSAYHPQTDGQSEVANREMERYLRTFVSFDQDNWVEWLPLAEFAINAAESPTTKCSPFQAVYGYQPRMSFAARSPGSDRERIADADASSIAEPMQAVWTFVASNATRAGEAMAIQANKDRRDVEYAVGDKVYLNTSNLKVNRPSRKLANKWIGPFAITQKINAASYRLALPASLRIHNVFHSSILKPDSNDPLPGQVPAKELPTEVEGEQEWEIDQILDVRRVGKGYRARAKWTNWDDDETYYPLKNFENSARVLKRWFDTHPGFSVPKWVEEKAKLQESQRSSEDR